MLRLTVCLLAGLLCSNVEVEEIRDKPEKAFELEVFTDNTSNVAATFHADQPRWYKVPVIDRGWLSIQVRGNPRIDFQPILNVYAVEGNKLKKAGSSEKKTDKRGGMKVQDVVMRVPIKSLEYYIEVSGTVTEKGGFNLFLAQSDREDNYPARQKDAEPILLDPQIPDPDKPVPATELKGTIDEESRDDWLTFTTPKAGYVTIEIRRAVGSKLHTHVRLHNEKTLLAQADERIKRQVKKDEVYWLHVRAGDNAGKVMPGQEPNGKYTLRLTYEVPPEN